MSGRFYHDNSPVNAFWRMDWRRRVARWRLAVTTDSNSTTTLIRFLRIKINRPSFRCSGWMCPPTPILTLSACCQPARHEGSPIQGLATARFRDCFNAFSATIFWQDALLLAFSIIDQPIFRFCPCFYLKKVLSYRDAAVPQPPIVMK